MRMLRRHFDQQQLTARGPEPFIFWCSGLRYTMTLDYRLLNYNPYEHWRAYCQCSGAMQAWGSVVCNTMQLALLEARGYLLRCFNSTSQVAPIEDFDAWERRWFLWRGRRDLNPEASEYQRMARRIELIVDPPPPGPVLFEPREFAPPFEQIDLLLVDAETHDIYGLASPLSSERIQLIAAVGRPRAYVAECNLCGWESRLFSSAQQADEHGTDHIMWKHRTEDDPPSSLNVYRNGDVLFARCTCPWQTGALNKIDDVLNAALDHQTVEHRSAENWRRVQQWAANWHTYSLQHQSSRMR